MKWGQPAVIPRHDIGASFDKLSNRDYLTGKGSGKERRLLCTVAFLKITAAIEEMHENSLIAASCRIMQFTGHRRRGIDCQSGYAKKHESELTHSCPFDQKPYASLAHWAGIARCAECKPASC